ncbi:MAG: hypothetical protein H6Q37_1775, partial [Chloroflexi bacterium]|nr:hypothetical protein [Chloroflexota bacterium]
MKNPGMTLESLESSSPIVTRSVAAGLADKYCNTYEFAPWQQTALKLLGLFPQGTSRFAISRFESFRGLRAEQVADLSIENLLTERLADYQSVQGPFPCITIGSALGGATAHMSLALGGPFLPQAFVLTLRGGARDGNALTYFNRSVGLAKHIAANNPNIITIQHFDPIHDEWMTRFVNHLRFKILDLPEIYASYIERNLSSGGAVCYLDCGASWLRYRIDERSIFQVGGWGGISAREFLDGSERIEKYCKRIGLSSSKWQLPNFPIEEGAESEWGSEPGLAEALEDFCKQKGFRFIRIRLPEPHDFSLLAYKAQQFLLSKHEITPTGVLVEMFSQFDATAVLRTGLLPVWLVFNTIDSLKFLQMMSKYFPHDKPVFFSPLATFTHTPDLVPWIEWEEALKPFEWHNIGTRSNHYPADSLALTNWSESLHAW